MRFREFIPEQVQHREGIDVEEHKDVEDPTAVWITASSHGRELGRVKFYRSGDTVVAQSLEVKPEYQGQGIARIMYDYAKELGYRILRSAEQTAAGHGFWDKHRGRTGVWESKNFSKYEKGNLPMKTLREYIDKLDEIVAGGRDPQEAALAAALLKIANYAAKRVATGRGDRYDREVARVFGSIAKAVAAGKYDKAQMIFHNQDTVVEDEIVAIPIKLRPAATRILGIEYV